MSERTRLARLMLVLLVAAVLVGVAPSVARAAPVLTTMSPNSGLVFGGTLVTVTGTGLDAITSVQNPASRASGTIKSKSPTKLMFETPAANDDGGATLMFARLCSTCFRPVH